MERVNRDIYPSPETVAAYPRLKPFVDNDDIKRAFARHERQANFWKQVFHIAGTLALLLLAVSTTYVGFELTLGEFFSAPGWAPVAATIAGGAGLLLQLLMQSLKPRLRWQLHRFGAERVRNAKFLVLMHFSEHVDAAAASAAAKAHTARLVADIHDEVNSNVGGIIAFQPADLVSRAPPGPNNDPETVRQAWDYYTSARWDVQRTHFLSRINDSSESARTPGAVGDMLFLAAAMLSFLDLAIRGWNMFYPEYTLAIAPLPQAVWYFAIWTFFVCSAILMVCQQAVGHDVNSDRYAQYLEELSRLPQGEDRSNLPALLERMYAVELIVLRELKAFLHDHRGRSYIF